MIRLTKIEAEFDQDGKLTGYGIDGDIFINPANISHILTGRLCQGKANAKVAMVEGSTFRVQESPEMILNLIATDRMANKIMDEEPVASLATLAGEYEKLKQTS